MGDVEREVKLGAWAGLVLPSLDGVVDGAVAVPLPPQRLTATYYDTADLRLARWGVTVRHRSSQAVPGAPGGVVATGEPPWTVKLPDDGAPAGGLARREVEFSGPETRVPAPAAHLVAGLTRSAPLTPVARLRTDRFRCRIEDGRGRGLAEIDDDEVSVLVSGAGGRGRRLAARFRELEVELHDGADPAVLEGIVGRLQEAGAGAADPTPKVVRALGPAALEPPDVVVVPAGRRATAMEAITAAIAASVQRLLRHDPGVRLGEDPEAVHQARVATRRLRSDLRTFRSLLDEEWAEGLRAELGWLAALLGEVRDTDVLLERLEAQAAVLDGADRRPAEGLLAKLGGRREAARRELLDGMADERYPALLDRLVEAAAAPRLAPAGAPGEAPAEALAVAPAEALAEAPAAEVLPPLLRRPWRHLAKAVDELGDDPSDDALHQVRIRAKRCRYAAEAVAPVVGKPAKALADAVAEIQSILGDFHDAVVAEAWLRDAGGHGPAARALVAGQLIAAQRAAAAEGRVAWRAAWKKASAKKLRSWFG